MKRAFVVALTSGAVLAAAWSPALAWQCPVQWKADRTRGVWMAYDVREDGTLGRGRVLFDATVQAQILKGAPDGMKVDHQGHLFAAGPGGIYILAPDGTHLGRLETGGVVSNVAWGNDGSVLYVTADTAIYRIRLSTRGAGF